MQIKAFVVGTVVALAASGTLAACGSSSGSSPAAATTPTQSSATGSDSAMARTGAFHGLNGKKVAGTATLKGATLTLTGYSSDQGPDLHVYLTNGTTESAVSSGVEISKVASDQMAQTFSLPSGTNGSSFSYVVIHCDKAKAVFGAASLS